MLHRAIWPPLSTAGRSNYTLFPLTGGEVLIVSGLGLHRPALPPSCPSLQIILSALRAVEYTAARTRERSFNHPTDQTVPPFAPSKRSAARLRSPRRFGRFACGTFARSLVKPGRRGLSFERANDTVGDGLPRYAYRVLASLRPTRRGTAPRYSEEEGLRMRHRWGNVLDVCLQNPRTRSRMARRNRNGSG